ncbi:unnamed protein product [marine sediment metagenome]|uniref:Uncharacterized protein n=1 Tax=marine sediment metagenome TaxID=412755 RepID=X1MTT3_9ZZZZ
MRAMRVMAFSLRVALIILLVEITAAIMTLAIVGFITAFRLM